MRTTTACYPKEVLVDVIDRRWAAAKPAIETFRRGRAASERIFLDYMAAKRGVEVVVTARAVVRI